MTKRLLATAAVFLLSLVASVGLWADTKGTIAGTSITWTLSDAGVLTVRGEGAIPKCRVKDDSPWFAERDKINSIVIGDSITSIGNHVFDSFYNNKSVIIGKKVERIGQEAFRTESLQKVTVRATTPPAIGDLNFTSKTAKLYVPASVVETYKASDWADPKYAEFSEILGIVRMYGVLDTGASCLTLHYDGENATSSEGLTVIDNLPDNIHRAMGVVYSQSEFRILDFDPSIHAFEFTSCKEMFSIHILDIKEIRHLGYLNTKDVTDFSKMFFETSSLTTLDLSDFDTSNATDMSLMFSRCSNLKSVDLSSFNTDKVTNMTGMFYDCKNLESVDFGLSNTDEVTNMTGMFYDCKNLKSVDLSSFSASKLENCMGMFYGVSEDCDIFVSEKFDLHTYSHSIDSRFMFGNDKDKTYARYDTADGLLLKKVGMLGGRSIGAHGTPLAIDRLALDDSGDFALTETETVVAAAATYSRTLTSQWGTLCLPYAISTAESNCRFYSISDVTDEVGYPSDDEADGVVYLKETEGDIPAGTPLLFCLKDDTATDRTATVAGKGELTGKAGTTVIYDDEDDNVDFVGVFGNTVLTSAHDRFFAGGYFRPVYNDKVRIPAFRAYLNVKVDESAPATYSLAIGGSTTGISAAEAVEGIVSGKAEYYTTDGRRTDGLHRGMNIVRVGGKTKKIFVR